MPTLDKSKENSWNFVGLSLKFIKVVREKLGNKKYKIISIFSLIPYPNISVVCILYRSLKVM